MTYIPTTTNAARANNSTPRLRTSRSVQRGTATSRHNLKTGAQIASDILGEIKGFFAVHHREGTVPGGVHLELTHEAVTECLGGSEEVLDTNLADRYQALCDPRLNGRQSLDLAFQIGEMLQGV